MPSRTSDGLSCVLGEPSLWRLQEVLIGRNPALLHALLAPHVGRVLPRGVLLQLSNDVQVGLLWGILKQINIELEFGRTYESHNNREAIRLTCPMVFCRCSFTEGL